MNKSSEAFRTIGEVAEDLGIPKHVLRFWEGKFTQIRPMKRGGGRRYYRPEDMELLKGIRTLLHSNGYTIKGVQKILRDQGVEQVKAASRMLAAETAAGDASSARKRSRKRKEITVPQADSIAAAEASIATTLATSATKDGEGLASVLAAIRELEIARAILLGQPLPHRGGALGDRRDRAGTP